MAAVSWKQLIELVENDAAMDVTLTEKVTTFLTSVGKLNTPADSFGLSDGDVEEIGKKEDDFLVRAAVKRTLGAAIATEKAKRKTAIPDEFETPAKLARRHSDEDSQSKALAILGGGESKANALMAANILSGGSATVNITKMLKDTHIPTIPQDALVPSGIFQLLEKERELAVKDNRVPFTYVDLTLKEVLPTWMSPNAVGGKVQLPEMTIEDAGTSTDTVQTMAQALKVATSAPRFFRSFQQWVAAWTRYIPTAVACKHLSVCACLGHLQVVTRICEEHRGVNPNYVALAVSYDELRRKDWECRAARRDEGLKIDDEAWKINRDMLDTAKSRLDQVVKAAGLRKGPSLDSPSSDAMASVAESALAKQTSAAVSAANKVESAIARLQSMQKSQPWNNQTSWSSQQSGGWQNNQSGWNNQQSGGWQNKKGKGKGKKGKGGKTTLPFVA